MIVLQLHSKWACHEPITIEYFVMNTIMLVICINDNFSSKRSVWEKASPPSDGSDTVSTNPENPLLRKKDIHGSQDTLYHSCWSLSDFPGNDKNDEANEDAKSLNESLLPSNSGPGLPDLGLKWSSYGSSIHGNPVWANIPSVRTFVLLYFVMTIIVYSTAVVLQYFHRDF